MILPLLTISNSVPNGAKYYAQSSLIALSLLDFFLIEEISEVPLFSMIIDVILANPLMDNMRVPIEVIQFDFVQGEVRVNVTTDVVCV